MHDELWLLFYYIANIGMNIEVIDFVSNTKQVT